MTQGTSHPVSLGRVTEIHHYHITFGYARRPWDLGPHYHLSLRREPNGRLPCKPCSVAKLSLRYPLRGLDPTPYSERFIPGSSCGGWKFGFKGSLA
ncbi:hypothetical protein DPEC_G00177710 [Dallia pectoralis]|uniref:Uncharacterized protein n=1 Tax=Dallia pectoralis TaxID=75939 RepID=A0ACC2GF91_DALPE|nr:hypothetical protein DPEC_G00177710 [Dallia pectoralis]